MMMPGRARIEEEIHELMALAMDEAWSEADRARLSELLEGSDHAVDAYLEGISVEVGLRNLVSSEFESQPDAQERLVFERVIRRDLEKANLHELLQAAEAEEESRRLRREEARPVGQPRRRGRPFLRFVAFVAVLLGVVVVDRFVGRRSPAVQVATVSSVAGELKGESGLRLDAREGVYRGREYTLGEGLASLNFAGGARAVLEGPATFRLNDFDELFLSRGRVFMRVPESAVGFRVDSPYGSTMDLGTEFGVEVDGRGDSEVHVVEGKVSVRRGEKGDWRASRILTESQAMRCESVALRDVDYRKERFARAFNARTGTAWRGETLALADVVGGGTGFGTGKLYQGIDPVTGRRGQVVSQGRHSNGLYNRVGESAFVDGVFIPNGAMGPVVISSAGHVFEECPETRGDCYTEVFNGSSRVVAKQHAPLILDGVEYGLGRRSALFMHANIGITFDLQAMRRFFPGVEPVEFRALAGITEALKDRDPFSGYHGGADFWVLVDGEVRFAWRGVRLGESRPVEIALGPEDRFLTLITTDGGDRDMDLSEQGVFLAGTFLDWCAFCEPQVTLRSADATVRVEAGSIDN